MASEELTRIAQITSQLLTFHRESRSPVPVNLNEVLDSVLVLFSPQIKRNQIQVEKRFETSRSVRGFPGELRQVFSNLVGNAIEAISQGGELILHTRESSLASDPTRAREFASRYWTMEAVSREAYARTCLRPSIRQRARREPGWGCGSAAALSRSMRAPFTSPARIAMAAAEPRFRCSCPSSRNSDCWT